jgi:hypothetical protein
MPVKLNVWEDPIIQQVGYLMFVWVLITRNRGIPRPASVISFPVVIFRLPITATGGVTRAKSGWKIEIPGWWRDNVRSRLDIF